jgi:hypothetical protein
MSLAVAVPAAIAAAAAYGAATAAEHSAAQAAKQRQPGMRGIVGLIRDPRWLLGMGGDTLGLALQVLALATGPVLLVQPLLVLALPISLPVGGWLGGPRPTASQYLQCCWILAGLGGFLLLVGNPGDARPLTAAAALAASAIVAGVGLLALGLGRAAWAGGARALIYAAVAGAWFGFVAVLIDAATALWRLRGIHAFAHQQGLVPLIALIVVGAASTALTQVAFQAGSLAASVPANLAADPVLAVVLGAVLLHERLPLGGWHVAGYVICLAAILLGAIRLAAFPATPDG